MSRQNYPDGAKWEDIVGYCRMVKAGNMIWVAGTVAVDEQGEVVGLYDLYAQTKFIVQKIEKKLLEGGATLGNVVRTRLFVTDISRWEEVAKAHLEFFGDIKPVTTLVEVASLINPECLVEIEMDVVLEQD